MREPTNKAVSIIELKNVLPYARMKNVLSELNTFLISEKRNNINMLTNNICDD